MDKAALKRRRMGHVQRRQQLIEAAVLLIGRRGIDGTTVSKISAEVGLSEMAAYRHFASKREILMEASSYLLGRILEWLDCSANPSIINRLLEIGERHLEMLSADLDMYTAPYMQFLTMSRSDDPLHHHVSENNNRMKEKIAALVREGVSEGSIRADVDPYLFTHEFVGWFLAEDIHCLTDLRDGTFSRSSHLRMLDLILGDIASPGHLESSPCKVWQEAVTAEDR
ncbi:MAG TPA: TetR/AcrR family transcriptional regulator [Thermoleophilia bacterium]|nr:TetR/AcrR family transcriptional regulator [Thermoleophilia bacterium]